MWPILPLFFISSQIFATSGLCVSPQLRHVPTVKKSQFDPNINYYHTHDNGNPFETPVLVENVLSAQDCEEICDAIVQELGDRVVDLQRKMRVLDEDHNVHTETDIIECELGDAFGYMMESQHEDSFFCFCEGMLDGNNNLDGVRDILQNAKEKLFEAPGDDGEIDEMDEVSNASDDLFRYFPNSAVPSDCLVLAGEGATSTLHRDPYTWTGTSLCLEGSKTWRFVCPPGATRSASDGNEFESKVNFVDDAVKSFRLPSMAWDDNACLSSGWQSDMSLYFTRSDEVPSAEEFAMLGEERSQEQLIEEMTAISSSLTSLKPSSDFPSKLEVWTVVQKQGDMLVIPAYWWHQTYALEPSLAVASQRCGKYRDTKRVISHILETTGLEGSNEIPAVLKDVLDDKFSGKVHKKRLQWHYSKCCQTCD